jgi:hypothetical protein
VPIDYQRVTETKIEKDEKGGKERRVREKSKNEMVREMYAKVEAARINHGNNHAAAKWMIYLALLKRTMELLSTFNMEDNGLLAYLEVLNYRNQKSKSTCGIQQGT